MTQAYKSYHFYDLDNSDQEETPTNRFASSKISQKKDKKRADNGKDRYPSSESDQRKAEQASDDSEVESMKKTKKKLKTDSLTVTKRKSENSQAHSTATTNDAVEFHEQRVSPDFPIPNDKDGSKKILYEEKPKELLSWAVDPGNTSPESVESAPAKTVGLANQKSNPSQLQSEIFEKKSPVLSQIVEELPLEKHLSLPNPVSTSSVLVQPNGQSSVVKKAYVPNAFDHASLMNIPKVLSRKGTNESVSKDIKDRIKPKSSKYRESSSSSSSRSPSPLKEKSASKAFSDLKPKNKTYFVSSSQESTMKEEEVQEKKIGFIIDPSPLGTIESEQGEKGEVKKLVVQERVFDSNERQYRVIGFERAFRTQEKNLLEKLDKFLIAKEEDEKKDEDGIEEENLEIVEDEFNFESRYFMYNPTKVCNRCKRPGHFERWCPEDITIKCLFCCGHHRTDDCVQIICFHCYGIGHRARDCKAPGSILCFRCNKKGHKSSNCGMIVLKDAVLDKEKKRENGDLKCMKCGRYGHSKCSKETAQSRSNKKWFDGLYKDVMEDHYQNPRERMNMKLLERAREVEKLEFEGAMSDGSAEDLANFARSSRSLQRERETEERKMKRQNSRDYGRDRDRRNYGRDRDRRKKKYYK